MHANNEIGTIQPVEEIGAIAREMKKDGETIDKIMKYTGLTEDEINEI